MRRTRVGYLIKRVVFWVLLAAIALVAANGVREMAIYAQGYGPPRSTLGEHIVKQLAFAVPYLGPALAVLVWELRGDARSWWRVLPYLAASILPFYIFVMIQLYR